MPSIAKKKTTTRTAKRKTTTTAKRSTAGKAKASATAKKSATRKTTAKKTAKRTTITTAGRRTASATASRATGGARAKKRTPSAAFMAPLQPDEALSAVIGSTPLPRTQVTKKIWNYIKRNDLQDANKRTMIVADAKLKPVFGGKRKVDMFQMTKLVNQHLIPIK